ncbi:hypothetical protein [Micromonospora sp. NPDC005299]|uniref:hypothetical protein n=1 Tax=Micromonospora sp. NPDC005299 TaxID=3364231 RepID=UPI0036A09081
MTRVGWCPGGRPVAEMLAMYPGTTAVRVFVGVGNPLPAWDGPVLGPIPAGVLVHLSFKTNSVPELLAWAAKKPAGLLLLLTYGHEPEQQKYGDPTVQQFHARWGELVPAFDGHPMRDEILLGPVYTRYWWQDNAGDMRWLVKVPVDFVGWDVYNNGAGYRTPDDLLTIPRDVARRTGLPYLIAELGAIRVSADRDGAGRVQWMRDMVAAAESDGAWTVCWFHKDEWTLAGQDPEQAQLRQLIQEASVDWHLAPSLKVLRDEINARWPGRDHTSDGTVGDTRHQATKSDHNPNIRGSVDAADFDDDGLDFDVVFAAIKRHPSARYVIYERKLYHRLRGWKPEPYDGVNPHDKHFHVSIDQTVKAEQNTQPWGLLEDDVTPEDKDDIANRAKLRVLGDPGVQMALGRIAKLEKLVNGIVATLPGLDDATLAEVRRMADADTARDAKLTELVQQYQSGGIDAKAVVDELVARLQQ